MKTLYARALIAAAVVLICSPAIGLLRSVPVHADGAADLSIGLDGPSQLDEGQTFFETLVVWNSGPDTGTATTATLTVPTGLSPDFSGCTASASGDTCTFAYGDIPPGEGGQAHYLFTATSAGQQTLSATVTSSQQDPNPSNNTTSATISVAIAADMGVTLNWQSNGQQYAGQTVNLTLAVTDHGPSPSSGATVTVQIPHGLTPAFGGCAASTSGMTCTQTVGSQPSGSELIYFLRFTAASAGSYTVSATVAGNDPDPNSSNNSTTSSPLTVSPAADMSLSASADPNPVVPGHQVTETVVLTNEGPSPATAPSWSTSWSSDAKGGIDFESLSVSSGSCALSGATIACQPGDLASGQQVTLTIVLQPRSKGTLVFDSSASSSVFDPKTSNNSVATSVTIS